MDAEFDIDSKKRIKKDALWKPLLRGFRIFLRRLLQYHFDINQIFDGSGDLSTKTIQACKQFLLGIGASDDIINEQYNHHALAVALAPSSASNLHKFFEGVPALQRNLPRLKPVFCTIFRENSIKLRQKFFREELI